MSMVEPVTRRWTVEEYHRAAEAGVFGPEERLELIDGEIVCVSPQNGPHIVAVRLALSALEAIFRSGWVVLSQAPIALLPESEPEPDLIVTRGDVRDLKTGPPTTAA